MLIQLGFLICSLLSAARAEAISSPAHPLYSCSKTFLYQNTSITAQNQAVPIVAPFSLYIHGAFPSGVLVDSSSALIFQIDPTTTFAINVNANSSNVMTDLEVWKCATNFTVHYVGKTYNNSPIGWYATFFNEGSNKFLIDPMVNTSSSVALLTNNVTYQLIQQKGATVYQTCAVGCFTCLKTCDSMQDCEKRCPDCYQRGGQGCANMVVVLSVMLAVLLALIIVDLSFLIAHRKCYTALAILYIYRKVCCKRRTQQSKYQHDQSSLVEMEGVKSLKGTPEKRQALNFRSEDTIDAPDNSNL